MKYIGDLFENTLKSALMQIEWGTIVIRGPYSFPTMLRVAESPDHYVAELLGSTLRRAPSLFKLKRPSSTEKIPTTTSFFTPGFPVSDEHECTIAVSSHHSVFQALTICTDYDELLFKRKLDFSLPGKILRREAQVPLYIAPSADYLFFQDVSLIRTDSFRILFRKFSTALVVKKGISKTELSSFYAYVVQQGNAWMRTRYGGFIPGLNLGYDADAETFAQELASLADQNIKEPLVDKFIQTHSSLFARALGHERVLSQIKLQWIERRPEDPEFSTPDYLMERKDGSFDILDLKRALLPSKYKSITIGKRARIRFNSYVSELCAQLQGYERYFHSQVNRQWAHDQHGITLEEPRLYGIVGNYDNFDREDVDLALQQYKDRIVILSYQDVIELLRSRSRT
jgi:hypothetical protein